MGLVNRWYSIMNILENSSSISENELMERLNIGQKTLEKSIKLLNAELSGVAKIYIEDERYLLKVIDLENYEGILSGKLKEDSDFNSISKRVAFIFKEMAESSTPILIDDLAESLSVSRGTVGNDMNRLRELIEPYNVKIIGKPNTGLKIEGLEYQVRLAYVEIVLDYFRLQHVTEPIKDALLEKIDQLGAPKKSLDLLLRVIEATFIRINNQNFINDKIPYYQNFLKESNFFQELIVFIEIQYNITLNDFERDFISYPLNIYNQGNAYDKQYDFQFVEQIFETAFKEVQEAFAIKINKDQLFKEARLHLIYLINRLVMHVQSQDIFINEVSLKYPLSHAISEIFGEVIADEMEVSLPAVETNYLSLYFEMIINQIGTAENKEIAIVYNTGHGTASIIKNQIKNILGDSVKITSFGQSDVDAEVLNQYFAIFSTVPLRRKNLNVPIIQISTIFDDFYVRQEWEKAKQQKMIDFEQVLFETKKLDSTKPYKENLTAMIDALTLIHYVDDEFKRNILEREKMKSTVFDNGIALPHAVNKKTDKLVISLGQFEQPIELLNKKVELVFMIGIPEDISVEAENTLVNIYEFIFMTATNEILKKELIHVDTIEQVKKIISKEVVL